ncbi:gas vesicle synthesis protein [Sandaracinus amylolyticus]|uniref:Gas vesicle synthesis protein n=2 Tax=Sandaracinus amylolyticus TaxID=927083 RepID=A0A0F6YN94_9BACT|nr:gas vesicle synthesis protein [Sandaracinus amylolyticus]
MGGGEMKGRAIYAYCIVAGVSPDRLERAPRGVPDGSPPRLLSIADGIDLVIADVDASAWSEDVITAGLRDIDWVSERALRHEEMVSFFLDADALVPMKAFTIFRSEARARDHVREREASVRAAIDRVGGCVEWGVRMRFDERAARVARERDAAAQKPASGAAFLARKKQIADATRGARVEAAEVASAIVERLAAPARAHLRIPPPEGSPTQLVAEAALLVPHDAQAELERIAEEARAELARYGVDLELNGPWAPYHFSRGA